MPGRLKHGTQLAGGPHQACYLHFRCSVAHLGVRKATAEKQYRLYCRKWDVLSLHPLSITAEVKGHNTKAALERGVDLEKQLLVGVHIKNSNLLANTVLNSLEGSNLGWHRLILHGESISKALLGISINNTPLGTALS